MIPHLRHLLAVLKHKALVVWFGLRLGWLPPWTLLVHDLSKFSRAEWGPYVRHFYGPDAPPKGTRYVPGADPAFDAAVQHHYHHNDHHPGYWLATNPAIANWMEVLGERMADGGRADKLSMPSRCIREMVIDWIAVGHAMGAPDVCAYYRAVKDVLPFDADAHWRVGRLLLEARDAGVIP